MRHHTALALGLLAVLALIAAACGDDATTAPDTPDPPDSVPPDTVPATAAPATSAGALPTTSLAPDAEPLIVGGEAGDANLEEFQAFLAVDPTDDGPFHMVNLIRYRERAQYPDGTETDLSGEAADAIYGEWMRATRLPAMGAEIVYIADVERDLIGGTSFDRVAVVRYPSRAEFAAMAADPEFQAMNVHKQAGVADTVVLATRLIEAPALPPLADPPHPATDDDPPFAFVHVLDYRDTAQYQPGDADADDTRSGRDAVGIYSNNAGLVAVPLGVRPVAWFEVEATLIGPTDVWDEVRINWFPSHATFDALTSDPTWEAGTHHRTAGLAATYAIQTLPVLNGFS